MIEHGHRREEIGDYSVEEFFTYAEEIQDAVRASARVNFEHSLTVAQGGPESIKAVRDDLTKKE